MRIGTGLGALAGIVLGAGVAFVVDSKGHPFYSERAVAQRFENMVVVGVPALRTPAEERSRRRARVAEWMAATVLLLAVAAVEAYVYFRG